MGRLLVVVLVGLAACGAGDGDASDGLGEVREIVDGDTAVIEIAGAEERVRLLGIDTPETVHPSRPVECFGPEASARLAELIPPGTEVRLERDIEPRDRFERLLLYVYRAADGLFVNEALVEEGYASLLVIQPNDAYAGRLRAAEARARRDDHGLWGACAAAPDG